MSLGLLQILMRVKVMAIPEGLEGLITPTHVLGVHRQVNFILADFKAVTRRSRERKLSRTG